ncbi:MAG: anthranilate phosphoribosyltransferase [Proteobacteria bacterium]|nr:MAG: anthranilate phosphoribosyltransferase [Pseudomonadota bacterium]
MNIQQALAKLLAQQSLTMDEMSDVMHDMMSGKATDAQIGGFLIALRLKGETVDEITAAAQVMRHLATPVDIHADHLVDIVGTGGDGISTFNISTACCFVLAAAGGHAAKHGNRSVSSKSGAADVLEAAGVNLAISPAQIKACVEELGVGFMFAVMHHDAMKHAIGPRKEMAVRTVFNILGPLTNPAGAPNQVLGVFSRELVRPLAEVLKNLGSQHVLVVHAEDGLDEISIATTTQIAELKDGVITEYTIQPEDFGFSRQPLDSIKVTSADESLAMLKAVLNNGSGAARDIVCLNAGAAIYVAGLTDSLAEGIVKASEVISSGAAMDKLTALIEKTNA